VNRYVLPFILLICLACGGWVGTGGFFGGSSPTIGDNYSDITFWWRCETADFSGTNGVEDYSAGDDTATLNSSAAINTDAVKYNTNGLDCPGGEDYAEFTVSSDDIIDADEFRIGFWYYAIVSENDGIMINIGQDFNNKIDIYIYTTDGIYWDWKDGNTTRTALSILDAGITVSTWHFIEFAGKVSTDYREVFVDGVSKGSSSETIGTFIPTTLKIGIVNDVANDYYHDEIKISNDSTRDLNALKDITDYPG